MSRKLSFFGSVLRDDFNLESDLDILVEFDPHHIPGLIKLAGMEIELAELLGRKVDMRTAQDLSRYFREEILNSAKVQYAERGCPCSFCLALYTGNPHSHAH